MRCISSAGHFLGTFLCKQKGTEKEERLNLIWKIKLPEPVVEKLSRGLIFMPRIQLWVGSRSYQLQTGAMLSEVFINCFGSKASTLIHGRSYFALP
jgi:hypothetical protein